MRKTQGSLRKAGFYDFMEKGVSSLPAAMGNTKNLSELTHLFSHCKQHANRGTSPIWLKE